VNKAVGAAVRDKDTRTQRLRYEARAEHCSVIQFSRTRRGRGEKQDQNRPEPWSSVQQSTCPFCQWPAD
jgi:hypothetical protein